MTYVVPLSGIGLADAELVGRKAAVLGALRAAGFAVPDGFAITADALTAILRAGGVDAEPPAGLLAELREALGRLGDQPVAVRSSGAAEDLADRSYAGQYESVLDVSGLPAVVDAVRRCWASGFSERLAAYHRDDPAALRLGVLVQVMVPAEAAGVAFSANPVTGDLGETVVSAVRGLGDRLMAGEVSADEWAVRDGRASRTAGTACPAGPAGPAGTAGPASTAGTAGAIDAGDAVRVAELAARVAEHLGAPQDIEWAIAGGRLYLLQARPITGMVAAAEQVPVEVEVPDGFWVRDRNSDAPWVPMKTSVFLPVFAKVASNVFAFTTGACPRIARIGGWVYLSNPPDSANDLAARVERIGERLAAGEPRALVDRWHAEWKPAFAGQIAALRDVALDRLTPGELEEHCRRVVRLFEELHDVYFRLTGAAVAVLGELGVTCADLLDWSPAQTLRLRGGLTGDHMGATVGLGELAALAARRPAVRALLDGADPDPRRLAEVDPEYAAAFDDYVRRYAHRTVGFTLTEPTLAEQPRMLLNLVSAQLARPYDFAAERAALADRQRSALDEAYRALAGRDEADRARFDRAFADSEAASPVRDEKVFYAVSLWALLRYAALELGSRLVRRGCVDAVEDALYLGLDEGLAALADGADLRVAVRRRRGEHAWALAHPGPPTYGRPPQPPGEPDTPPSPAAQRAFRIGRWSMSLWGAGPAGDAADGTLRGVAASPGRYTGPVRVIRTVTEFGRLRRGDVLVCPETTAQWAVLFPSVGALVTDRGSLLSHPAIIAREYGVPAVVATGNATTTLRDGTLVTVDGSAGVVRPAN